MINKIRKRIGYVLPLIIFFALYVLFKTRLTKDPYLLPSMLIGKEIPSFEIRCLNKEEKLTDKQFKGHITLLNVWASWCPGCQIEHPILMDLAKSGDVHVYGLNYKDKPQDANLFLENRGNPYQEIIDDPKGKLSLQFGVYGTPESFLIDEKGIVRYRYAGPLTLDILEKDLLPRIRQIKQGK
jgi:cytochrome c biogenesis protein CcmG/thiol:disulfide interchange protein DsbE